MLRFLVRRLLYAIPTILIVTFLVFLLMELSPVDPAVALAGDNVTPERLEELHQLMGLDRPFLVRYGDWLWDVVHLDLGVSPVTHQSVSSDLMFRLPITASLVVYSLLMSVVASLVLGTLAALRRGGVVAWVINALANLLLAVPPFMAAILLVLFFAILQPWFPATGYASITQGADFFRYMTMPALALAIIPISLLTRQVRGAMIDVMEEDYIRTARAKGLRHWKVVGKHAAKNAATPVVTTFGLLVASTLGGSVVVEKVFAIPGLGSMSVDAVLTNDLVTIQGFVVMVAVLVIGVNLLVDLSYGYFDPKLRNL